MHVISMTIVMSARKDKSGKRRQGPLQIVVTGNMTVRCCIFSSNTSLHVYLSRQFVQYLKELGY